MDILKIGDWIVIAIVVLVTLALSLRGNGDSGSTAVVFIDSVAGSAGPFALNLSRTIDYDGPLGPTTVEIEPPKVRIAASPCRHQICVSTGWIGRQGEVAVCLPNRLVVRLEEGAAASPDDPDAISQ